MSKKSNFERWTEGGTLQTGKICTRFLTVLGMPLAHIWTTMIILIFGFHYVNSPTFTRYFMLFRIFYFWHIYRWNVSNSDSEVVLTGLLGLTDFSLPLLNPSAFYLQALCTKFRVNVHPVSLSKCWLFRLCQNPIYLSTAAYNLVFRMALATTAIFVRIVTFWHFIHKERVLKGSFETGLLT